jgi:protein-tyrosine phosphatase
LIASGYDSAGHKASKLNGQLIGDSDLVLVMEKGHHYSIMERYPQASGKVMLLGKWSDDLEITDPYRKSSEAFTHIFNQIEENCIRWVERLS